MEETNNIADDRILDPKEQPCFSRNQWQEIFNAVNQVRGRSQFGRNFTKAAYLDKIGDEIADKFGFKRNKYYEKK